MYLKKSLIMPTLIIILMISCSSSKLIKPYSSNEFFYDEENFSLIRLFNQENSDELLNEYNNWISKNPYKAYEFYENKVLNLSESYFEKREEFDKSKVTQKPELISRPAPEFPNEKQMVGNFLKVVVTVTVDTLGNAEFATLFDIYRTKDKVEEKECNPSWTCTQIFEIDKPYIKSAILAAQKIKYSPYIYDKKKTKVKINIPYHFNLR